MRQEQQNRKKENRKFLTVLVLFGVFYYLRYFKHTMTGYNTTLFAMSYRYGFISRGLLGSIWEGMDALLPADLMTYEAVYWFNLGITVLFYAVVVAFCGMCMRKVSEEARHNMYYMILLLAIFLFPMFWSEEMFGRLDVYLYLLTFAGLFCLVEERWEWLILPIGIVCMCIHQGFVFTNANLLLVPLFYRILTTEGKKKKKYIALFAVFLLSICALFLYFEFFSHGGGAAIYEEVVAAAKALSEDGRGYNKSLIKHEILGQDVYASEARYHKLNRSEFPAFLLLYSPYFFIALHFFGNLLRGKSGVQRWYLPAYFLGAFTILPQYLLKVDFGRYAFTTFSYYIIMTVTLIVMGEKTVAAQLQHTKEKIKETIPVPLVVLLYPMFLMPFYDVIISGASSKLRTLVQEILGVLINCIRG